MAKLIDGKFLVGSIGNLRFYTLNNQTIVSAKGGPSAKQIKTRPSCARIRQNILEFGMLGKMAGYIKRASGSLRSIWYKPYYDQFFTILKQLLKTDSINSPGQRNLQFSNCRELFSQLQLSQKRLQDFTSIRCNISRIAADQLQLQIPEINSYNQFSLPPGYYDYEYSLHAMCLPDIFYDKASNSYPPIQFNGVHAVQEIFKTDSGITSKVSAHEKLINLNSSPNHLIFAYLKLSSRFDVRLPMIHCLMLTQLV